MESLDIDLSGMVILPWSSPRAGRLVVSVDDTSLADAEATTVCAADFQIAEGEGPSLAFSMTCTIPPGQGRFLTLSARVLYHNGHELARGDATTVESYPITKVQLPITLVLKEI